MWIFLLGEGAQILPPAHRTTEARRPDRVARLMRRSVAAGVLAPLVLLLAACGSGSVTTPTPNTVIGNAPTTTTAPTGGAGNAAAGKVVFTKNCSACHTLADANAKGTVGPNLDQVKP